MPFPFHLAGIFNASLSILSILPFACVSYPETSPWTVYLFMFSSYFLPYFLNYAIPPYSCSPYRYFGLHSPISYCWQPLVWHALYSVSYTHLTLPTNRDAADE